MKMRLSQIKLMIQFMKQMIKNQLLKNVQIPMQLLLRLVTTKIVHQRLNVQNLCYRKEK